MQLSAFTVEGLDPTGCTAWPNLPLSDYGLMKRFSTLLAFREMQIKSTVGHPFTAIRMARVERQTVTSVGEGVERREPCALLARMEIRQLIGKHGVSIRLSNSIPGCPLKRNENIHPHKILNINVHSSIIHNSQKVETTQMLSHRQTSR